MKNKLKTVKLDHLPEGVSAVHWVENWKATDRQGKKHERDILHLHYLKMTPKAAAALAKNPVDGKLEGEALLNALRGAGMKSVNIPAGDGTEIPSAQEIDLNDGTQLYRAYSDEKGLNNPGPGGYAIRAVSRKNPDIMTLSVNWINHALQDPPNGYAHVEHDDETGRVTLRAHFNKGKPGTGANISIGTEKFDGVTGNTIYQDLRDKNGWLHSPAMNEPAVLRYSATESGKVTGLAWCRLGEWYYEANEDEIAQVNATGKFPEKSYNEIRGIKPPAMK